MKRSGPSLGGAALSVGVSLTDAQLDRLAAYEELLRDRAVPLGLVAASDRGRLRERHVVDSLRAAAVVQQADRIAYDIGSGAGLPGIPVAVASPALIVRLVEPRRVRAAFLELALERLGIRNAEVVPATIESVDVAADLCLARAFAPLEQAWRAARPRLRPGGRLVYFAGAAVHEPVHPRDCSELEVLPPPHGSLVESAGPLVIMTR